MPRYCPDCGTEQDRRPVACPECDFWFQGGSRNVSYVGSIFLIAVGILSLAPTEGYNIWWTAGFIHIAVGLITLPDVRWHLYQNHDINFSRGLSWVVSIVGFIIGLSFIPA